MNDKNESVVRTYRGLKTLVWGERGKKILLLHGFPESPEIYSPLAKLLEESGFQVFSPYLPGYGESPLPSRSKQTITLDEIADSIGELSGGILSDGEKLILVGHDWGAVAAYVAAAKYPEKFTQLIAMSVPPLPSFLNSLIRNPKQILRSSYILFFQLGMQIPERMLSKNGYTNLKQFCQKWSDKHPQSAEYFGKDAIPFNNIQGLSGPLAYYRGLFPFRDVNLRLWCQALKLAYTRIKVPTVVMVGERDQVNPPEIYKNMNKYFSSPVNLKVIPDSGHFIPIDNPYALHYEIQKFIDRNY